MDKLPDELKNVPLISRDSMLRLLKEDTSSGVEAKCVSVWRRSNTIFTKYFFSSSSEDKLKVTSKVWLKGNEDTTFKSMLNWIHYRPKMKPFQKMKMAAYYEVKGSRLFILSIISLFSLNKNK